MKTWFAVKILFRADALDSSDQNMFEESIRLVKAETESEALLISEQLGKTNEHQYANEFGETVHWSFVEVLEIQDLCETAIFEGVEVYSKIYYEDR